MSNENVEEVISYTSRLITDEILISAYDLYYGEIKKRISFPSVVFLDSGGYEASEDTDLSDPGKGTNVPRKWKADYHRRVLRRWDYSIPTVVVSFDSPTAKTSIEKQIDRASRLFDNFPDGSREILFKTPSSKEKHIDIKAIIKHKHKLAQFDVIGITEKELGASTLQRMANIAQLRHALISADIHTPIHVFGSLDSVTTTLYFLVGADIFDGLTWLRYAFYNGETIYKHNYGAKCMGVDFEDFRVNGKVWNDNYYYLFDMKSDMAKFLVNKDFGQFRHNSKFYETAWTRFSEDIQRRQGLYSNGR